MDAGWIVAAEALGLIGRLVYEIVIDEGVIDEGVIDEGVNDPTRQASGL